uniref:Protein transport protein SEC31 n=1 Tax=Lygus hesperus TaxID=30085 RepID=A0A0A9W0R8_LYGHE
MTTYWDGQQPKDNDEETKGDEDRTVDTPAIEFSEDICNVTNDCSTEVSRYNQIDETSAPESSVFTGVQTSISSVKLTENVKCSETISEVQLSVDYSTNYMVRSDSLVNFLPNAHFTEKPDSATIFHSSPESNDDSIWISDTVSIIPEINVDTASALACRPIKQSCLEEIMCTSTGILKLSDSCGEVRRYSVEVEPEENSTPENKISEKMNQKTPVTQSGFPLPCVFRYDVGGGSSDIEKLGSDVEVANDMPGGQGLQIDIPNVQTKTPRFDSKGKELGQKVHNKEESNEQCSTKSEDDTMENIDELSYDVNLNIIRGENSVQEIESQREEFHLDPVPVSSPKSTQVNDVSVGTGTNENLPSLPKSEIYFQGRTNSSGQPDGNFIQNVGDFENPEFSLEISPNVPNYNFSEEFVPQLIPADYNADNSTVPVPFGVNAVNLDDSIPIVSVGMTSYYGASKWQEPIPYAAPDNTGAINFDTAGLRFISKNESLFYTHMRPENKPLNDGSESFIGKLNSELYPFIDGASYVFGIPEEVRKDDYFNPCVGAAPSGRAISGKTIDNSKCEALKVGGFSLDEQNNLVGRREESWSMGQRLLQHDQFPLAEGIESKYRDGCYRSAMAVQVESEHLQKNTQPCTVWNASEQLLPVQKTSSYHNGFESSEQYQPAQETVHQHPVDFVPIDYLQGAVYENDQEAVCNSTNGYEFINPYEVGVFPMLNIPFCLPDPSYGQRGPIPPFVFPIGPVNMEQNEGPPVQLEADAQNGLYPLTSHPYWVGFQADGNESRTQNDISIKNEMPPPEMTRNYPLPQICVNEPVEERDNDTEECPIPDPYFQLAENSSLHSVKSKAESYNGSLFCESLRSILSSHNAESDNVIPSFSCSSMKCYNPSLVVRSCETSLSNDSLPSIIVEGSYSKSVDEDYPAKEKFMNDVNTALNESMMDQILCNADEFPISFLGRGDFEAELMGTSVDTVPEDIERTLHGIMETNDESELNNNFEEEYSGHTIIPGERMEVHNLESLNQVEEDVNTAIQESEVNDILTEILVSVVETNLERMKSSCSQSEVLVYDDHDSSQIVENNGPETWVVPQMEVENIIVQHNVVQFDGISFVTDRLVRPPLDESIEIEGSSSNEDGKIYGNNEMVNRIVGDKNETLVEEVLEVPFEGINSGLINVDDGDHSRLVNMNAHRRESTWNLQNTENQAAIVDDRGTEVECEEKLVSCGTEMSVIGKNLSKSNKRNSRRKKKRAEGTKSEGMITEKIGIGDGSTQQKVVEQRRDKQENQPVEVTNLEHITVPEAMEGMVGEPSGSHEDQERTMM